jgi:hypothetical protein
VELLVLRHEVAVLRRANPKPRLDGRIEGVFAALVRRLPPILRRKQLVTPGTILRWHHRLVVDKWTYPHRVGRLAVEDAVAMLIERMARENPTWGYQRIQGELRKLGHHVEGSTIRRVLQRERIPPAPSRDTDTTWRQFLRTQASTMLACDFFQVDCAMTLKRIYVLFVLGVPSRSVHVLATTTNPDGQWTTQQIRNLVMNVGDRATEFQFLVRDRTGQFTASFDAVLAVGHPGAQNSSPLPAGELFRRTVRPHPASRTHRPHIDRQPATPACSTRRVRWPLQRSTTSPRRDLRPPRPTHLVADLTNERIKPQPVLYGLINEYERAA